VPDVVYTGVAMMAPGKGDSNLDNAVDFGDLSALSQNYNSGLTTTWEQGDFNNDHLTDFADLVILSQNYNQYFGFYFGDDGSVALASESLASMRAEYTPEYLAGLVGITVPEPSSALVMLAIPLIASRRSRRAV
jgi:hypothetical protein